MELVSFVKSNLGKHFESVIEEVEWCWIVSPYIKQQIVDLLIGKDTKQITVLTNFKIGSLVRGASDIEALEKLLSVKSIIKHKDHLHAKIYLTNKSVLIGSANFTPAGFYKNVEYTVLIQEPSLIAQVKTDINALFSSPDCVLISEEIINDAKSIIAKIPEQQKRQIEEKFDIHSYTYPAGIDSILEGLSGWKKELFVVLNEEINQLEFDLNSVYKFEPYFQSLYPDNLHIKDKLRQTLQYLRDLGLVEFIGRGKYKKLWES